MARIELVNICKTFDERNVPILSQLIAPARRGQKETSRRPGAGFSLNNVNLTIPHARTMVLLGPSGCGKTTLLKIIAGLVEPDAGEVKYNGENMRGIPPGERRIGMLFQNYALYPHFKVKTNILSYFLFRPKTPELNAEAEAKYRRTSELMGVDITYLQDRMPTNLSGGEKQRVALGRCITRDPALFLLDEPFSNLDQKLREKYRVNLKSLLKQFNITTIYVTHDQHEALILADLIAVMDCGTIAQVGTYEYIYDRPTSVFVAEFLNPDVQTPPINLIDGARVGPGLGHMQVGVRPEDVTVSREPIEDGIQGTLADRLVLPVVGATILTIRVGDDAVVARVPGAVHMAAGEQVWITMKKYHVFEKKTGRRVRTHPT